MKKIATIVQDITSYMLPNEDSGFFFVRFMRIKKEDVLDYDLSHLIHDEKLLEIVEKSLGTTIPKAKKAASLTRFDLYKEPPMIIIPKIVMDEKAHIEFYEADFDEGCPFKLTCAGSNCAKCHKMMWFNGVKK